MIIVWAVLKIDGTVEGEFCGLKTSSNIKSYNKYQPPEGHTKALLTIEEYEKLKFSWNHEDKIYEKRLNLLTMKTKNLTVAEKKKIKDARPNKYRERINAAGNIEKEFYDKSGNLERTEVVDKDGIPIVPK